MRMAEVYPGRVISAFRILPFFIPFLIYSKGSSSGETGRRLGDRIREHLYDVRNNDSTKPVSRHFNLSNHSLSDFIVFGLSLVRGDNDCRKTKEMRLIHQLGTHLIPMG